MPSFNFKINKEHIKCESQCRYGHRKCTTSKNKIKDTPIKHGLHLEDYNRQCVYMHFYDKEENPFYIGQGTIQRAFVFKGSRRNAPYNDYVKDINLIRVKIVSIDNTVTEGVKLETKLINKYKLIKDGGSLINIDLGGRGGARERESKAVVQLDIYGNIIKEYKSAKIAAHAIIGDSSSIHKCCKHVPRYNSHRGFKWEYKENINRD